MILEALALTSAITTLAESTPFSANFVYDVQTWDVDYTSNYTTKEYSINGKDYEGNWVEYEIDLTNSIESTFTLYFEYNYNIEFLSDEREIGIPILFGFWTNQRNYYYNTYIANALTNYGDPIYMNMEKPTLQENEQISEIQISFPISLTTNHVLNYNNSNGTAKAVCFKTNIITMENYQEGYNSGYSNGYNDGYGVGEYNATQNKNQEIDTIEANYSEGGTGYTSIYNVGYNAGYDYGYNLANTSDTNLSNLMLIIATTPFETFNTIWNFDILGFNLATFTLGLLTLGIVLIIWKKIR